MNNKNKKYTGYFLSIHSSIWTLKKLNYKYVMQEVVFTMIQSLKCDTI